MKRVFVFGFLALLAASPAMGISEFSKQWRNAYLEDNENEEFVTAARRASCNVCHVKGEDKKEVKNEYGQELAKLLDHEDYPRERIKAEPEKVAEEIKAAFKKVESAKSKDGKAFGAKIKAGELPATDAKL